jgi:hypothetical protein
VLPAAIAANVAWCSVLTLHYPHFFVWLGPTAITLCVFALALFGAAKLGVTHRPRLVAAGMVVGLASVLLVPAGWSASALSPLYNQAGGMARVGPTNASSATGATPLTPVQHQFLTYLTAHRDGAKYLAAAPGWGTAAAFIIAANAPVLPMGGFTGQIPSPTLGQFQHLISSGELRYVILSHSAVVHTSPATPENSVVHWVAAHCAIVPSPVHGPGAAAQLLYRCGSSKTT